MAGIGVVEDPRRRVVDSVEDGRIPVRGGGLEQQAIDPRQDFAATAVGIRPDRGVQRSSQQGGGHSLPGHVRRQHAEPAFGQRQEIVVVAADAARRPADSGVIQAGDRGKNAWEQPPLHLFGQLQLASQALFVELVFLLVAQQRADPRQQHQVEDHEVRRVLAQRVVSGLPAGSGQDLVRLELQVVPQAAEDGRIVFDNENATHEFAPPAERTMTY